MGQDMWYVVKSSHGKSRVSNGEKQEYVYMLCNLGESIWHGKVSHIIRDAKRRQYWLERLTSDGVIYMGQNLTVE